MWLEWISSNELGREVKPWFAFMAGLLFALIFTLIFLMIEQAISDIRSRLNRSQPRRVDAVFPKLPDNGVTRCPPADSVTRVIE